MKFFTKKSRSFFAFVLAFLGCAFLSEAQIIDYKIDKAHSSVNFTVNHLAIVPVEGKFDTFEGSFKYNTKTQELTDISIKVEADSIDTNEADRDNHLRSADFFGVRDKFSSL